MDSLPRQIPNLLSSSSPLIFFIWLIHDTKLGNLKKWGPGEHLFYMTHSSYKIGWFGKVRIRGNTHNKKTQTVVVSCSLVGRHPYCVPPFPLLSLCFLLSGALCLGFLCLYTFSLSTQRRRKNQSPHQKSVQPRALWASLYDASPSQISTLLVRLG